MVNVRPVYSYKGKYSPVKQQSVYLLFDFIMKSIFVLRQYGYCQILINQTKI